MTVSFAKFQVTGFEFCTVAKRTILNDKREIAGVRRRLLEEHATGRRGVFTAQVHGCLLEPGEVGALDPNFTQLALDRNKAGRFLGFDLFPNRNAAFFHLDLGAALLIFFDIALAVCNLNRILNDHYLFYRIHRRRKLLDLVSEDK